jgi:3-oxoadipate enol-lactonase
MPTLSRRRAFPAIAEAALARAYQNELRTDAKAFATYRARWLANDPGSYAAIYRMLAGLEMTADLAAIRCPALIHAGTKDPLRPPAMLEPVAKLIAHARFEPVETGHYAAWQTPPLVAASLNGFLPDAAA